MEFITFDAPFKYESKNSAFKELLADKLTRQHFMKLLGFRITKIEPGYTEGVCPLKPELGQQDGFVHGGVTATAADIVTGLAAFSLVGNDDRVVTSDLKISYFRPGKGDYLFARGWVLKPGSRLQYCEGEIYVVSEGKAEMIAKATAIMATLAKKNIGQ